MSEVETSVLQRFVRHLEWARDLTVRQSVFRRPIFLVDEVMGESTVEIQTEILSKRALEARAATDRLSRLSFEKRQEILRQAQISPELVYEIYRRAEVERDLDEAFAWTDHLVHIDERLVDEGKRGGEINEALAPGYTLRLDLSLDLVLPWTTVEESASRLMDVVEDEMPDHQEMLRAWRVLGRCCRERNQLYLAESFLLLSERWAREWRLDLERATACVELAVLAFVREELVPATLYILDALTACDRAEPTPQERTYGWFVATRVALASEQLEAARRALEGLRDALREAGGSMRFSWVRTLLPWLSARVVELEGGEKVAGLLEAAEKAIAESLPLESRGEAWVTQVRLDRIRVAVGEGDTEASRQLLEGHHSYLSLIAPGVAEIMAELLRDVEDLQPIKVVSAARHIEQLGPRAFELPIQ